MFLVTNQLNNKKVAGVFSELKLDSQKMWIAVLLCATTYTRITKFTRGPSVASYLHEKQTSRIQSL